RDREQEPTRRGEELHHFDHVTHLGRPTRQSPRTGSRHCRAERAFPRHLAAPPPSDPFSATRFDRTFLDRRKPYPASKRIPVRHTCAGANIVVFYKTWGKLATRGTRPMKLFSYCRSQATYRARIALVIKGLDAELMTLTCLWAIIRR